MPNQPRGHDGSAESWWGRAFETVSVLIICAVALGLRVFRLDRVPQGILHDEAYNGLDAERILNGARPIFLVANNGREALFMYLQAVAIGIFGPTDFALRSVSALLGFLTVPATYLLFRRLFGRQVALLGTAWLALSLWHLIFSRVGLRAIALPLVECLVFYFFWRALTVDSDAEPGELSISRIPPLRSAVTLAIVAGVWTGVSLYTYSTARFLPFVLIVFVGYLAICHPKSRRRAGVLLLVCGVTALLVFAPEARFFVQHPSEFVRRADEVSIFNPNLNNGGLFDIVVYALVKNLGMFSFVGDGFWDRNIAYRPIFDSTSSALLLLGLIRVARGWRRPANALVTIWVFIMLLPGIIAVQDAPDFLRVVGVIPAIFVIPALGADWILEQAKRMLPRRGEPAGSIALALVFLAASYQTYGAYFVTWARSPGVAAQFNSDLWEATTLGLQAANATGTPTYVGAGDRDLPSLAYRFPLGVDRPVYLFDPARSLVFPSRGTATYFFAERRRSSPTSLSYLDRHAETVATLPSGLRVLRYRLSTPPDLAPSTPLVARFGDSVEVLGFDIPKDSQAGQTVTVRWYWRIRSTDSRTLSFSNQVFDGTNHRLGIRDDRAFAPGYWPPGTEGISSFDVPIDAAAESGAVWLKVAIYDRATLGHLPLFDSRGRPAGDSLRLGPIKLHGKAAPAPTITHPLLVHFADNIDLAGYDVVPSGANAVQLTLYWSPRGRPAQNYTVFVHALGQDGKLVGQADAPPKAGTYPTSVWDAGETITDPHVIPVDPSKVSSFAIGLYLPENGKRVPVVDGPAAGDTATLPSGR